jgi:hypothetical protein
LASSDNLRVENLHHTIRRISLENMGFYELNFAVLASACGIMTYLQYRKTASGSDILKSATGAATASDKAAISSFTKLFLVVYMLTMGADW